MKKKIVFLMMIGLLSFVFVQPSSALTVTLQPGPEGKDANIRDSNTPSGYPPGDVNLLLAPWWDSAPNRGLLEFDLSSVAGVTVTGATVSLYHKFNDANDETYGFFRNTDSWDEGTVTWDNAPAYDLLAASSLTVGDSIAGIWRDWDVTALVQGWITGAYDNFGMTMFRTDLLDEPSANFSSSDYTIGYGPKLIINYDTSVVPEPSTYQGRRARRVNCKGEKR